MQISFDYILTWPAVNTEEFFEKFHANISEVTKSFGYDDIIVADPNWPSSVLSFVQLLRLLPETPSGKLSKNRATFQEQIDNFILFTKVLITTISFVSFMY